MQGMEGGLSPQISSVREEEDGLSGALDSGEDSFVCVEVAAHVRAHARTHAHTHTLSPPSMGVLASSYIFSVPTAISLLNPLPPCTCEHTHVHLCKHSDLSGVLV